MDAAELFERRLACLDLSLFAPIVSQSSPGDRASWLAVQRAVRRQPAGYSYLEIGSHLGGSIQQHLVDPACRRIFSIDKRPLTQPDDRGKTARYDGNSTERMLDNLRAIDAGALHKLVTFDADASAIDPSAIDDPPAFCFIDGEHTRAAVVADFAFCLRVAAPGAVIAFHDAYTFYPALRDVLAKLHRHGPAVTARKLDGSTFAIHLGDGGPLTEGFLARRSWQGERWLRVQGLRKRVRAAVPVALRPAIAQMLERLRPQPA